MEGLRAYDCENDRFAARKKLEFPWSRKDGFQPSGYFDCAGFP